MKFIPYFSVIIPTFNRSKLLSRAIKSVLDQSFQDWELIIVDNYSLDNTEEVVKSFNSKKIKLYKFKNNGIIGASRNYGIKQSIGNYIAFLDSDDWWKINKLDEIKSFLPDYDIIYHNCYFPNEKKINTSNCRSLSLNPYDDLIINGNTLITSSVIVSKSIFNRGILFSESKECIGWEDYALWLDIAKEGYKFKLIKDKLAYYNIGDDNFDNPKRILKNVSQIKDKIIKPYLKIHKGKKAWWLDYTKGRANYNLGRNEVSKRYFLKVVFSSSPVIAKLKSVFFLLFKLTKL